MRVLFVSLAMFYLTPLSTYQVHCSWVEVVLRGSIDVPATQDIAFWFEEQMCIGWCSPRVDNFAKI